MGKVASHRPHLVLSQTVVLWSVLQLAHGDLLVGGGGVVAGSRDVPLAVFWMRD